MRSAALLRKYQLCEKCGSRLGYLRARETLSVVEPAGEVWRALADPDKRYRFCANAEYDVCNWLVDQEQPSPYCLACRHNLTVPDLAVPENVTRWRKIEYAKHRLMYSLLKLQLPLATRAEDPIDGLGFEFLVPGAARPDGTVTPVMTGHANGVITISLTEADDAERERTRSEMGEAISHAARSLPPRDRPLLLGPADRRYGPSRKISRNLLGDEQRDYGEALKAALRRRSARRLAEQFRLGLCLNPPVGRLRRNLGALFSYHRHAGIGTGLWHHRSSAGAGPARSLPRPSVSIRTRPKVEPIIDSWTGLVDRGQRDQPQHGAAGPLSVRPCAGRRCQAQLHPRKHPCATCRRPCPRTLDGFRSETAAPLARRGLSRADFC